MNAPGDKQGRGGGRRKAPLALKSVVRIEGGARIRKVSPKFLRGRKKSGSRNNSFPKGGKLARESGAETRRERERELHVKRSKVRGCQSEVDSPFKAAAKPRVIRWHNSLITVSNFPPFPNRRLGPQALCSAPTSFARIILLVGAGKLPSQLRRLDLSRLLRGLRAIRCVKSHFYRFPVSSGALKVAHYLYIKGKPLSFSLTHKIHVRFAARGLRNLNRSRK